MDVAGLSVVVVGLARSGTAAARLLARRGARVLATDRKPAEQLPAEALNLTGEGVRLELGGHRGTSLTGTSLVVVSPGVPWDLPELEAARRRGVPVIAELELGWRLLRGSAAAVTGTKGKSTTTAGLGAMLREAGRDARVGGNIGAPLSGLLDGATDETVFVLEVSSFQLEGTETFRPAVAVFLNVSADHLDRHPSFDDYLRAKGRIFRNQTEADWAVVNADDPVVLELARGGRARRLPFHVSAAPSGAGDAAFFEAGEARLRLDGRSESLFRVAEVRLPGAHLAGDLLAAAAAARLLGAPPAAIARAVGAFTGVEHVLERVAEIGGVTFYNDSKATNVDAARKSLEAFAGKVVAVMGGRYKGGDFADLKDVVADRVRAILAIGEARDRIAGALGDVTPVTACASLREAVTRAHAVAEPGDAVVLAPGCSSFDMFQDYAERGRAFKDEVRRLAARGGGRRG
jgi:UDP-N-acetylmuramoylalanine--D-glutamate ligase